MAHRDHLQFCATEILNYLLTNLLTSLHSEMT